LLEGPQGGLLLRGPAAAARSRGAQRQLRNHALHLEILAVRGPAGREHRVLRQRDAPRLEQLLEQRLGVLARVLRVEPREQRLVEPPHSVPRGDEAPVEEYRTDERFERRGEDRWPPRSAALQLALAEAQLLSQREVLRQLVQGLLAHQARAQPRQVPFGQIAEALEQFSRDHAVENAVAEELQPLVVGRAVAAVRERLLEQLGTGKGVADALAQSLPAHGLR